jgi:acyl-CoA thioesterase-1
MQSFATRFLLLLFVAACFHPNQAGAEPFVAAPNSTAAPKDRSHWPVIVAFGDSLTAVDADEGQSYPDYLQKDLIRDGYDYRVVNLGVGGNTTKDGLARIKDVLMQHPALVIVGLGGNDGLRGEPVDQMRTNLDRILAILTGQHIPVILGGITLPPNYGQVYVQKFNAVYPELARKYHVPLLPFMLQGVWNHPEMMHDDGIHPTGAGNVVVAQNFLPFVEHALREHAPGKPH